MGSSWHQGALAGVTKRRVFQIKGNAASTYCAQIARKRETSENEVIVFGLVPQCNKRKMALGRIVVAFCRRPRIAHCSARIYDHFVSLPKAPWLAQTKLRTILTDAVKTVKQETLARTYVLSNERLIFGNNNNLGDIFQENELRVCRSVQFSFRFS